MKRIELKIGKLYGRIIPKKKVVINNRVVWFCICSCGTKLQITSSWNLRSGTVKSCGCKKKEHLISINTKHGMVGTREYRAWENMITRCENKKAPYYKHYGGRGIKVCTRWRELFTNFYDDMGEHPGNGYSLDRIDNNGDYELSNCHWTTQKRQRRNTRTSTMITIDGVTKHICDWSEISGIHPYTIKCRLQVGRTPKDAVFTPKHRRAPN